MAIRTIFSTVEDCSRGAYEGWVELVRDYAGVARTLLSHYFPTLQPEIEGAVKQVFATARTNDNAWFRTLHYANEREFAMAFRDLVFACGRSYARLPAPGISTDQVFALLEKHPVVHQELFWAFLKGWDVQQASAMLMNASATAEESSKLADAELSQLAPPSERANIALMSMEAAEARRTPDCLAWKTFNNIINGQISWNDREAAERHIGGCVHCLNAFTAFQEMIWLKNTSAVIDEKQAEALAMTLGFQRPSKGLLSRIFQKAS